MSHPMKGQARDNNPKWLGELEKYKDDGRNGPDVRRSLSNSSATIPEEETSVELRKRGGKVR